MALHDYDDLNDDDNLLNFPLNAKEILLWFFMLKNLFIVFFC